MATEQNNDYKFSCINCDYYTNKKSSFDKHNLSARHNLASTIMPIMPIMPIITCKFCKKLYNDRTGLWKHKKKCNGYIALEYNDEDENDEDEDEEDEDNYAMKPLTVPYVEMKKLTTILIDTVKQNQELQKQSQEFQQKIFDMMKDNVNTQNTMINSHNNTTNNNKFNLNFFLNETCKDAMNINEFIDSIKVSFEDVEYSGMHGFT